jgi:hypothetical protein
MFSFRLAAGLPGLLLCALLLGGCRSKTPPANPDPAMANQDAVRSIRQSYQAADPNARVGVVTATLPEASLAEVRDVDPNEFRVGDAITFIDPAEHVLVNGTVVYINPDSLHVKYETPRQSQRPPRQGDLALRFKTQ